MTRIIAIALTAASLTATAAAADSFLPTGSKYQDRSSVVQLDTVRAERDGVVEIYSFHTGEIGDLLGSAPVRSGANADVRVNLGAQTGLDAIALLKIDGEVVDQQEIEFR